VPAVLELNCTFGIDMVIEPKNANEERKKNISIFIIYMDDKKL